MLQETRVRGTPGADPLGCRDEALTTCQTLWRTGAGFSEVRRRAATKTEWRSRCNRDRPTSLIRFSPLLLAQSLPRKRFLRPALLAGFHVEAVLLDFLDDVFLLHLALKAPQGILQGFTLLDDDFSHFF